MLIYVYIYTLIYIYIYVCLYIYTYIIYKCHHANKFYSAIIKQSIDWSPLIPKQQLSRFYVGILSVITLLICLKIAKFMKLTVEKKLLLILYYCSVFSWAHWELFLPFNISKI